MRTTARLALQVFGPRLEPTRALWRRIGMTRKCVAVLIGLLLSLAAAGCQKSTAVVSPKHRVTTGLRGVVLVKLACSAKPKLPNVGPVAISGVHECLAVPDGPPRSRPVSSHCDADRPAIRAAGGSTVGAQRAADDRGMSGTVRSRDRSARADAHRCVPAVDPGRRCWSLPAGRGCGYLWLAGHHDRNRRDRGSVPRIASAAHG